MSCVSLCLSALTVVLLYSQLVSTSSPVSAQTAAVRIMPLGDSITTHSPSFNSYRRPLWHALQNARYNVDFTGSRRVDDNNQPPPNQDFDMDYEGHPGWRVDDIQGSITGWMNTQRPDIVLLHIGTNDLIQGQSVESTATEISVLIDTLRASNPNVTILLAQIIPFNRTHGDRVPALNNRIAALAAAKHTARSRVILVDQYSGFNVASDTHDSVHPNAAGEQKLANRWYQALTGVLGSTTTQPTRIPNTPVPPTPVPNTPVPPAPEPAPDGNGRGLTGRYFDGINFGTRRDTRVDPMISFYWNNGSPASGVEPDGFSVRWTGRVVPRYSERYTFYTTADDGVRLWVNERLLVDNWRDQGPTEQSGTIRLRAGRRYRIRLEYYDRTENASVSLAWSSPSQPRELIPQSQLLPNN